MTDTSVSVLLSSDLAADGDPVLESVLVPLLLPLPDEGEGRLWLLPDLASISESVTHKTHHNVTQSKLIKLYKPSRIDPSSITHVWGTQPGCKLEIFLPLKILVIPAWLENWP